VDPEHKVIFKNKYDPDDVTEVFEQLYSRDRLLDLERYAAVEELTEAFTVALRIAKVYIGYHDNQGRLPLLITRYHPGHPIADYIISISI
jgi:hypothetical protein